MTDLNEKIIVLIHSHSNVFDNEGNCVIDDFSFNDLSNEIEKLVLQDMFGTIKIMVPFAAVSSYAYLKLQEIEKRLNELNQVTR